MIVVVTGSTGSGKTTAIRRVLEAGECLDVEKTFPDWFHGRSPVREAYSQWCINGQLVAAVGTHGTHHTNRGGGDTFLFAKKRPFAEYLGALSNGHDAVLFDTFLCSPGVFSRLHELGTAVHLIWLDTDSETANADRQNRHLNPGSVKFDETELAKQYRLSEAAFEKTARLSNVQVSLETRATVVQAIQHIISKPLHSIGVQIQSPR